MEDQPFALKMQQDTIAELEKAGPKFMVVIDTPGSWLPQPNCKKLIIKWAEQYLRTYYIPVGVASLHGNSPTDYRWGGDPESIVPTSPNFIMVLERKQQKSTMRGRIRSPRRERASGVERKTMQICTRTHIEKIRKGEGDDHQAQS